MKFILLVGLPGSGKTRFGNDSGLPFFDDLSQHGGMDTLKAEIPEEYTQPVVVSDFCFIFEESRRLAADRLRREFLGCALQWVAWENDLEACLDNIERRGDERLISVGYMEEISRLYTYPLSTSVCQPLPVYKNNF